MTEAALQELIKREFPAEMLVTEVADKLDTMQAHPDIEQIRTWFNNVLLDVITLDYLEYSENRGNFLKEQSVQSNLSLNMPNWFGIIISLLQRKKNVCC